ncbi:MAG: hypothetical protein J4F49_06295, partial [Rhodobacteraceae bacterium]|nr:hypothetical protein [Paracoccaceae bacterium]
LSELQQWHFRLEGRYAHDCAQLHAPSAWKAAKQAGFGSSVCTRCDLVPVPASYAQFRQLLPTGRRKTVNLASATAIPCLRIAERDP